eukprot:NODE_4391_length_1897_cov_10.314689.p1 GENE.NODE_4391_length_1897_cov_10.314689~~NODE_4391_length_1897_cov_10.314689.p1  ORF type:complete len:450 (-),score=48.69 NODE_4391_length_1897_cov_10.314689:417-1766(-)
MNSACVRDTPHGHRLGGFAHLMFCSAVHVPLFIDRTVIAGFVDQVKNTFHVDAAATGMLGSAFLGGVLVCATIIAPLGSKRAISSMIIGLIFWVIAVFATALATDYWLLLAARTLSGCGEAAFCNLAIPIVDDAAPPGNKSKYLAVFQSIMVVATGLGYILAGLFHTWAGARILFFGAGFAMIPLLLFFIIYRKSFLTGGARAERCELLASSTEAAGACDVAMLPWPRKFAAVLLDPQFLLLALSYAAQNFMLGGLSFWLPDYIMQQIGLSKAQTGLYLGVITVVCGIGGTIGGGVILDIVSPPASVHLADTHARTLAAIRVTFFAALLPTPLFLAVPWVTQPLLFFPFLVVCELGLFGLLPPLVVAIMGTVDPELRGLAITLANLFSHVFGDFWPPPVVGYIQDRTGSLHGGAILMTWWILWCVLFTGLASLRLSRRHPRAGSPVSDQ